MSTEKKPKAKAMEFPHASEAIRSLMVGMISRVESDLLPCTLPQNVQHYHNESNTSQASLQIRSGSENSPIDFVLISWLHCRLPSGADLHISSLSAYLDCSTDAPHFLMELIQSSPTSLILVLDLVPRKDLALHPDYLKKHYEDSELDREREVISRLPEVTPYLSSSLYIRSVVSPTAILVRLDTDNDLQRMDQIVEAELTRVANRLLHVFYENIDDSKIDDAKIDDSKIDDAQIDDSCGAALKIRDGVIKKQTIQIDLGSSLPRLFGQDIADTVLDAIHPFFT